MATLAYKYRIKDSTHIKWLSDMAKKVNWCWNATQDFSLRHKEATGKYSSYKEIEKHIAIDGLHSQTVQQVAKQYVRSIRQFKKHKLRWRSVVGVV